VTIEDMKLTGLLSRTHEVLPGVTGVARVDRRTEDLLRRIGPGDIAVLDALDLDRRTAEALIAAEVVGVVNSSPSISGRFPNLGPEALLQAASPRLASDEESDHAENDEHDYDDDDHCDGRARAKRPKTTD